jgi:hypothetical protein
MAAILGSEMLASQALGREMACSAPSDLFEFPWQSFSFSEMLRE